MLEAIDYEQFQENVNAREGNPNIIMIIGKVAYIDHFNNADAKSLDLHKWYFTKNISYEHERELRIYAHSSNRLLDDGLSLPVDTDKLISKICFSPYASDSFKDEVNQFLEQQGMSFTVTHSLLAPSSFYLTVQLSNVEA